MFTICDYDKQLFNSILLKNLQCQENVDTFLYLINCDYISISGSSILQILQNKVYNDTDLDIYIEISNITREKLNNIKQLFTFLYSLGFKYYNLQLEYVLTDLESRLNYIITYTDIDLSNYSTLKQYIKHYAMLTNNNTNSKIDFIFIKSDIETLLLNTFDYDIVKNYYKNKLLFSLNLSAISNKIATMNLKHFVKRILSGSKHEFTNFINRYIKYSDRDFKIIIHKTMITSYLFNYIVNAHFNANFNKIHYYNFRLFWDGQICLNKWYKKNITMYYSNKLYKFEYIAYDHILKYILIAGIYQKVSFSKKLSLYSNYILNDYVNPESKALLAKINNWDSNLSTNKSIYYLNNKNELNIITFK